MLTLIFTRCYILSTGFSWRWITISPTITRTHKETKTKWLTKELLSSVSPVQVLYANNIIFLEQVAQLLKKPNFSLWQNADVCRKPLPTKYIVVSAESSAVFCRGKLKNYETTSAFNCRRTKHLNFKVWAWYKWLISQQASRIHLTYSLLPDLLL